MLYLLIRLGKWVYLYKPHKHLRASWVDAGLGVIFPSARRSQGWLGTLVEFIRPFPGAAKQRRGPWNLSAAISRGLIMPHTHTHTHTHPPPFPASASPRTWDGGGADAFLRGVVGLGS